MRSYINTCLLLMILSGLTLGIVSCERDNEVLTEPVKDLKGTWRISKVLRNSSDITEFIDVEEFKLTLQENSYTIEGNNIPFVVNSGGNWSVDDPMYPYNLSFTPTDNGGAVNAEIGTAVLKGQRSLNVNFSPGCHSNQYVYVFEKVN